MQPGRMPWDGMGWEEMGWDQMGSDGMGCRNVKQGLKLRLKH